MRILLMNSARTWGGTEKWTCMAAESLASENTVFLVYRKEIVGKAFSVQKYRLPCRSHVDLYTLFRLVRIIRKEGIEVIIPTKRKDYLLAGLAARICGITNILRLGIQRRLQIPFFHRLVYHTLADGIIVNAEKIKETLLRSPFMQEHRIRVIYNGVDTQAIERLCNPPAEKPFDFVIATAGVLTNRKGQDFLIRSFAKFAEQVPDHNAGLVIMGEGPRKKELQNLSASLGMGSRVIFTGFVDNPYRFMASSDIFAMTSKNEGIPNAMLEAMYLENVPVSTAAGGTGELIRDGQNGFLVEYGDTGKLAGLFTNLAKDPEKRNRIARTARTCITERFTIEVMKKEITAFCQRQHQS
ncbi:glycosyltransferase [Chlorobium limicola]